jgi:hypothetical protein
MDYIRASCPVCNSGKLRILNTLDFGVYDSYVLRVDIIRKCEHCQFIFSSTAHPNFNFNSYYQKYDKSKMTPHNKERQEKIAKEYMKFFNENSFSLKKGGIVKTLLFGNQDIFIENFLKKEKAYIYKTDEFLPNVDVTKIPLQKNSKEGVYTFNILHFFNIFEHLTDINSAMKCVSELMRPESFAHFVIPDAESYTQNNYKVSSLFEKINHFSLENFDFLLKKWGFQLCEHKRIKIDEYPDLLYIKALKRKNALQFNMYKVEDRIRWVPYIESVNLKEPCILFGAGTTLQSIIGKLDRNKILHIVDNDKRIIGKKILNYLIEDACILQDTLDKKVLIVSEYEEKEMYKYLLSIGYKNENILTLKELA